MIRRVSQELWIAGVPFFDSLSYVFLCYCSYATALFILAPLKTVGRAPIVLETLSLRRSFATLLLGSLLQTYLDIIIDPVALQGERWFLGKIYSYRETGYHFGIPLSNYSGWFIVSLVMIFLLQRIAVSAGKRAVPPAGVRYFPGSCLLPVCLYLAVIVFNLTMALVIKEMTIAMTGIFIALLPSVIVLLLAIRRLNRYSRDELAEHLHDFPWSPADDCSGKKTARQKSWRAAIKHHVSLSYRALLSSNLSFITPSLFSALIYALAEASIMSVEEPLPVTVRSPSETFTVTSP